MICVETGAVNSLAPLTLGATKGMKIILNSYNF